MTQIPPSSKDTQMAGCSVVISTFNRLESLRRGIPALLEQTYPQYELIFVDDGSSDGTTEFLDDLARQQERVKVVHHTQNKGLSEARNSGFNTATYDAVAFTDDDVIVDKKWVEELMNGFLHNPKAGFVFGQVYYVHEEYRGYFPERCVQNKNAYWPMGGNIVYKKEVFETAGFQDTTFFYYNNEDSEMAIRAVAHGFTYERAPKAIIRHQYQEWTVPQLLRSARNASVWPILKKRYPSHFKEFGPPVLGTWVVNPEDYLLLLFLPVVVPILLVRYLLHGKRDMKLFFAKWPVWLVMRRYCVYKEALRNRVWMV